MADADAAPEEAATAEIENKRKLEEEASANAEANGTGEDANKRPRVDGEPDAATDVDDDQQNENDESSSVNVEKPAAAEDTVVAPALDLQATSDDEKPLEAAAAQAPQQEGDHAAAAAAAQYVCRNIQVPNNKIGDLIGKRGETIRDLQLYSGAKIMFFLKDPDADPNSSTRPVEVSGSLGNVEKAEQLIKSVIANGHLSVGSSVNVEEPAAAEDTVALAPDLQTASSDEKPLEAAAPAEAPQQEEEGDHAAAGAAHGICREIHVPRNKIGALIGRTGETIRDLQLFSGAKFVFFKEADADPIAPTRRVEVSGSLENVEKAEQLIKIVIAKGHLNVEEPAAAEDIAAQAPQQEGDAAAAAHGICRNIQVPKNKMGVLIGRTGKTIRDLQHSSGARIRLINDADADPNAPTQPVEVSGSLRNVERAEHLIKRVIAGGTLNMC